MWSATSAAVLLLASQVSASILGDVVHVIRRDEEMDRAARRFAEAMTYGDIQRRDSPLLNTTAWDTLVENACITQLATLNGVASNPSGLAVCYNVPSVNTTTGVFCADLRLYMVAPPTGNFAGVAPQNIEVALAYPSAMAKKINESALQRRNKLSILSKRAAPLLVQSYALEGMLNMNSGLANATADQLKALLTPIVTLTAQSTTGTANTTVSSSEASFLLGMESAVSLTNLLAAVNAVNMTGIAAVVNAPGVLFKMPGTQILIFPIGAIVTGVWAVLLLSTIAYGTAGRIGFRDQFRRQTARSQKGGSTTI